MVRLPVAFAFGSDLAVAVAARFGFACTCEVRMARSQYVCKQVSIWFVRVFGVVVFWWGGSGSGKLTINLHWVCFVFSALSAFQ